MGEKIRWGIIGTGSIAGKFAEGLTSLLDAEVVAGWDVDGKHPKSALVVKVEEAFLHCGKALIRAKLWGEDYKIDRSELPPYGQMLKDQMENILNQHRFHVQH